MRAMRILASVVAAVAFSAIMAAQAAAVPEFLAEKYPVHVEGTATNNQGFGDSLAAIAANCETATASSSGEGLTDPTGNSKTLSVHPVYGKVTEPTGCTLTLLQTTSGESKVNTEGCNYVFHANPPNKLEGATDIKCGKQTKEPVAPGNCKITSVENAACEIKIEAKFLAGCVVSVPAQTTLAKIEYKNEPAGEANIGAEVSNITTNIAGGCGVGKTTAKSEYREGEVKEGKAHLAPEGKRAKFQSKGKEGVNADPIEVGANEPHWYENKVPIAAQSGGPGQEGNDILMWGKVTLASTEVGTTVCQTIWGGDVYNTQGAGPGFGFGNANKGEFKIDAMHAYDCAEPVGEICETTQASKLSVEPEGLGTTGTEALEWEGKLTHPFTNVGVATEPIRLHLGNKAKTATQVALHAVCPKTTGTEYNAKWTGEVSPELETQGSGIGSAPTKFSFGTGAGTPGALEVARTQPSVGTEEGKVTNKVKLMGYEGGEIISTKEP